MSHLDEKDRLALLLLLLALGIGALSALLAAAQSGLLRT